ncbi:MAG: PilZ domain-containing protein [Magnetococcales bacterium]|nr:PilZ domain-containing protein [Magnetococcales bacterium]
MQNADVCPTRAERYELQTRVLLELSGMRAYIGMTINVSDSGLLFELGYPPIRIDVGETGLLHLMPLTLCRIIPCQVSRLTESGVAVQFLVQAPVGLMSEFEVVSRSRCRECLPQPLLPVIGLESTGGASSVRL